MSASRISLGTNDRLRIGGIHMRPVRSSEAGHLLCHADDPRVHVEFTHAELADAQKRESFRYEPDYFDVQQADARLASGIGQLYDISRDAQCLVGSHWGWANEFLDLVREQAEGPAKPKSERISRSDAGMRRAIEAILAKHRKSAEDAKREHLDEADPEASPTEPRKARYGSGTDLKAQEAEPASADSRKVPSVRTLRKYVVLLEGNGSPTIMRPRTDLCKGAPRLSLACEALMARVAARYASETRPTKASLYLDLKLVVADAEKAAISAGGAEIVKLPSRRAFYRRINALNAFTVHAARFGLKSAERKFGSVTQGLGATRPGQFVLIDEFRVPLQTIMVKSGVWELLSEKERKSIEKLRPWLCVALDAATRVILGMTISRDQSTTSVLATLRMVMTDKGQYADAVGALSAWDMAVRPEIVMTDAGSNMIADPVRAALAGLRIGNRTGAASRPQLRALIERVFGTFHTQLLSRFTGRSFANVVQKGDYDSEARASLTPEDLCWVLVRYVVDQYHNSPHEGLGGETPANRFRRLTQVYPPRPLPDPHTMRSVFGFDVTRRSGPRGVRVLGLFYQGLAIRAHRRNHNDGPVTVRIDEMNMGGVSVLLDGEWAPLQCITPHLEGVTTREWIATATAMRNRHGRDAKITEPILLEAIRAIQERSTRTIEMFGLGGVRPSQKVVDHAERTLDIGWTMPGSEAPEGDGTDFDIFSRSVEASSEHSADDVAITAPQPRRSQVRRTGSVSAPKGSAGRAEARSKETQKPDLRSDPRPTPETGRRPGPRERQRPSPGGSRIVVTKG